MGTKQDCSVLSECSEDNLKTAKKNKKKQKKPNQGSNEVIQTNKSNKLHKHTTTKFCPNVVKEKKVGRSKVKEENFFTKLHSEKVNDCNISLHENSLQSQSDKSFEAVNTVSKSKKRRNRKKKILEALGISFFHNSEKHPKKSNIGVSSPKFNNNLKNITCSGQKAPSEGPNTSDCDVVVTSECCKSKVDVTEHEERLVITCDCCKSDEDDNLSNEKHVIERVCLTSDSDSEPNNQFSRKDLVGGCGSSGITDILAHNNVQGLFRSALLKDTSLQSKCSEKEVKNFFNTYGTFCERNRPQFKAVENLFNFEKEITSVTVKSGIDLDSSENKVCQNISEENTLTNDSNDQTLNSLLNNSADVAQSLVNSDNLTEGNSCTKISNAISCELITPGESSKSQDLYSKQCILESFPENSLSQISKLTNNPQYIDVQYKDKTLKFPLPIEEGVSKEEIVSTLQLSSTIKNISSLCAKMQKTEKTREEILAEREAKKAAKAAKKGKGSNVGSSDLVKKKEVALSEVVTGSDSSSTEPSAGGIIKGTHSKEVPAVSKVIENGDTKETKSKAELKAERRAKQEAQRAAKALQLQNQATPAVPAKVEKTQPKESVKEVPVKSSKQEIILKVAKPDAVRKVKLFVHLYPKAELQMNRLKINQDIHPAILSLGVQYARKVIVGSNARCVALLHALKEVIQDYKTPTNKEFSRGLEETLKHCQEHLEGSRTFSVSMSNALRHVKWQMTLLPNKVADEEAKMKLLDAIDIYKREQIEVAKEGICHELVSKIKNNDVILTYGFSSLILSALVKTIKSEKKFRLIVVDGRPWQEGREMVRRLVEYGIDCTYCLISAASYVMREVTMVLLEADAVLANGYVMSQAGSSQIALIAKACNVPVGVCCETHKFSERVQTDSFVCNELGNPDEIAHTPAGCRKGPLSNWRNLSYLTPLNLTYDFTPPDLVTSLVTERNVLPCTSVPVILRTRVSELGF